MSDLIRNLPDRYFLDTLVPPLVANLDTRGLLMALLGGWQDRIADLRSTADRFPELIDATPEPYTCVLVTYRAEPGGNTVPATLDLTSDTPAAAAELPAWAAAQLDIEESRIVSATLGTDALREIGIDTLQYFAASIGAVLYPGLPGEDAAVVAARQQQALSLYFPRLKLKGTPESFSIFARLAGFDEGALTPLWTRLSPREPGNLGLAANEADFRAKPDFLPTGELPDPEGVYSPLDFTDGPFHTWSSGSLTLGPTDPTYYPTVINGRNPFVSVVATGEVQHPPLGTYTLVGGASGRKAQVSLESGTDVSHLVARALTDGGAFNGLRLTLTGSGSWRELTIEAQLAALKYRSSYYDLALYRETAGTCAVTVNPDLMADPALVPDGTAVAPYRPWSGGTSAVTDVTLWPARLVVTTSPTVRPREQAAGTLTEIDTATLLGAAQRVYDLSSEVRAATRFPRKTGVGLIARDDFQLAAFPCVAVLAVTAGTGSFGGVVGEDDRPRGGYTAAFGLVNPPAIPLTFTTQSTSTGTYSFRSTGVSGSYFTDTGLWYAGITAGFTAGTLTGYWSDPDAGVVRDEPSNAAKAAGTVCYTQVPEGSFYDAGSYFRTWDDVPWLRPLQAGGENVNSDLFIPFDDPDPVLQTSMTARVLDKSGVYNRALVYDLVDVVAPAFLKLKPEDLGAPVTMALAGSGTSLYPVVGVSSSAVVADGVWNRGRYDQAILWWPLAEHPAQPLAPVPALGLAPDSVWLHPGDRRWDEERGWALQMSAGGTIERADVGLPNQYSFACTAKTRLGGTITTFEPAVRVGAAELHFSATAVALHVRGAEASGSVALPLSPGTNALIYVNVGTDHSTLGVGDATGWKASTDLTLATAPGWLGARLARSNTTTQLHDFMVWEGLRERSQLEILRAPVLVAAGTVGQRPYVAGVSSDRWALRALPSGFVVPVAADAAPEVYPTGAVRRYEGTGRYEGNPAYKQVGLGGAQTIPQVWQLGIQGPPVAALGEVVVAGTWGEPGINEWWAGSYGTFYQVAAPYGPDGGATTISAVLSGSNNDWPPALAQYNVGYDRIYLKGDNSYAYQVRLDDLGDGPVFVASIPLRPRPARELPMVDPALRAGREVVTDFETALRTQTYALSVNTSGTVYSTSNPEFGFLLTEDEEYLLTEDELAIFLEGEFGTAAFYLYLTSRVKSGAAHAFTRWVNPTAYGQALGVAARETAGALEFENTETLPEGNYRLSVDVGNIGTVDSQFVGFEVQVVITTGVGEPLSFPAVLLPEGTGTDPRDWTRVEFTLPYTVTGAWRLSLNWSNDRDVPTRGEYRRFAVYAYTVRRIASELHRITAYPLQITPVNVAAPPLAAGAYVARYNSYGTVGDYVHEQNLYSETQGNDTFNNCRSPLADTLTGSTLDRRDRLNVLSPWLLPDPATPTSPTAGTLLVTPVEPYYNVGDVVDLSNVGASGVGNLRRVWHNGSAGTTTTWAAQLDHVVINTGGTWSLDVDVVDALGRSARASASLVVNAPPSVQLATASLTSSPVPYTTQLAAVVADPEGDDFALSWYRLPDQVTPTLTLIGTGSLVPDYLVEDTQQVRVYAIDDRGGTNFADVPLTGGVNTAPTASFVAIQPAQLKGYKLGSTTQGPPPSQTLRIAAVARDPENRGVITGWSFWDGSTATGETLRMAAFGGGTLCTIEQRVGFDLGDDLSTPEPGTRGFSLRVADSDGNASTITGDVQFVQNQVPIVTQITVSNQSVEAGAAVQYAATAFDPDGDTLSYTWRFPALGLELFGPNVSIDTTGLAGRSIGGRLVVTDGYGGTAEREVPSVAIYSSGLAPITLDPAGGVFSQGVVVTVGSPDLPDASIAVRYSVDGVQPSVATEGLPYTGPVMVPYAAGETVVFHARAFWTGTQAIAPTELVSATFTFTAITL